MKVEKFLLPAGIGFAALCVLGVVALVLRSRRTREQDKLSAEDREKLAVERRKTWRRRLAVTSLSVSFVIIFCIAGIAAWLSFGAQKAYAFDRNGGSWTAATGFALLLDAGALGLSLLRLFEALTARSSQLTRFYLVGFIVASAVMNLLHTPHAPGESPTLGGRLVAVIPPLVYAIFLESLLKKVEQLVLGKYPKKKKKNAERGYSLLLWVPFVGYPRQMWKRWREDLHDTLEYVRAPGSRKPLPATEVPAPEPRAEDVGAPRPAAQPAEAVAPSPVPRGEAAVPVPRPAPVQQAPTAPAPVPNTGAPVPIAAAQQPPAQPVSPQAASRPPVQPMPVQAPDAGSAKSQLREVLVAQIRNGDLRVLADHAQVRNGVAYAANIQLGKAAGKGLDGRGNQEGLMQDGAVRRALGQLLPELRQIAQEAQQAQRTAAAAAPPVAPEPAPEHQGPADDGTTGGSELRERQDQEAPVTIGHQRESKTIDEEKEAALA
ncbi:DUF2637 domain-containing protein [Streptomyces candidus]|uniref:DUF2637 domain-containing protein n=1 Tax=Streptomyces candidus TaxID=67283 RepID=A0A7X0HN50_9ACTN|nr:DUF2637 domain-containing protein [Streptomyces candidus]MBB6439417.1 hypothetical protein [Streptomyces candidus]GHH54821.1 hypothetical protein GCM10018773_58400 [Streptomyces candidus]